LQAPPQLAAGEPQRPADPGAAAGTEHLSSLKQTHLQELAALTGLGYARLQATTDVAEILQDARATRNLPAPVDLRAPLIALALALIVFAIGPARRLPKSILRRPRVTRPSQSYLM